MHQGDGAEMIRDFLAVDARIALFRCFHRKADDVLVAGLDEHIADVKAHGALLDAEILGDFLVAHVAADALQDLELAARQLGIQRRGCRRYPDRFVRLPSWRGYRRQTLRPRIPCR